MRSMALLFAWLLATEGFAADTTADAAGAGIEGVEKLLGEWQFDDARIQAERLLGAYPDLPAVQLVTAWVKFHLGEHQTAATLAERAAAAFGGRMDRDARLLLIRATARVTRDFERFTSPDGKVVVSCRRGPDEILVPYLDETVRRTLEVVGGDLGYRVPHPILVEIVPDAAALADMTGLREEEIRTSGTIAVCKFNRLLITSPRATLQGFSWLDTASHELTHLIISERTRNRVPIWLHEALAKFEDTRWRAGEPLYREGLEPMLESNLARALAEGRLITFEQMHPSMALLPSQEAASLAFSEVYTVARFLLERKGFEGFRKLLDLIGRGRDDLDAIREVYQLDQEAFVKAWLAWLGKQRLRVLDGEPLLKERDDREGGSRFERALAIQRKTDLRDFFHLGQLLRARSRDRAAAVEYQKAYQRAGPNHAALWLLADKLGVALLSLRLPGEARKVFEKSIESNPEGLEAHLHLGEVLLDDDPYRAFLHLRECLRINPLDPRVHRLSLKAVKSLRRKADARMDWAQLEKRHQEALRLLRAHADKASDAESAEVAPSAQTKPADASAPAGFLRIHTNPWARVWLDYRDTGLTTPVYQLEVTPGVHTVGLVASCTQTPITLVVHVGTGETSVIDRDLCTPGQP